jgi:hypothetical protein
MTNARAFWTSTLQDLSNDTKNTPIRGVLASVVELYTFGSPGGLQVPNFGSVSFILTLGQKGVATSTLGVWSHGGFLDFQRAIAGVKTHWIEYLFISMESY